MDRGDLFLNACNRILVANDLDRARRRLVETERGTRVEIPRLPDAPDVDDVPRSFVERKRPALLQRLCIDAAVGAQMWVWPTKISGASEAAKARAAPDLSKMYSK
jgi:hypothetical protein